MAKTTIASIVAEETPFLAFSEDKTKIVCALNNHELPADRLDVLEAFVNGKKYKKLKLRKSTEDWAEKYEPFLVPSVNFPNMMFCALTNHVIKKNQAVVEEHLKGRKFKTAQERFKDDKADLYEEPTIAEMEAAIAAEDADLDQDRADADASSEDGSFDFEPMEDLDLQLNPTTTAAATTSAKPAKRKTPPSKPSALKKAKK